MGRSSSSSSSGTSLSSELATGQFFHKYNVRKCIGYLALLIASLTVMGYIAEECSRDGTGGCDLRRFSFLVAGGAISAGLCLLLLFLNLTRLRYILHVELLILVLLFCLWAAMAAVASSPKTPLGADVGRAFSWIGFLLVGFLLLYILEHKGVPFKMSIKIKGTGKKRVSSESGHREVHHEEEHLQEVQHPVAVDETTTQDTAAVQV